MSRILWGLLLFCLGHVSTEALASEGPSNSSTDGMRRFVVAAGANFGGPDRVTLRYAISDAERFADVMTGMGGVDASDRHLLNQPTLQSFEKSLDELRDSVALAGESAGRTEVLLYYSGHADETGLLLGEEHLSYRNLREMIDSIDADVRITVLDACASGAITRLKGGKRREAFLVDSSSSMEGYAFLTSSSADEGAQESDRIGASFFTHYLISGMRGAADASGEGKVTLGEAYQFAFNETLASTTETEGGAQHPAYDINLSGTGDVVMTDVRETSAGLLLSKEIGGRFYVRNEDHQLVAELYKPIGRTIELGLEPGKYEVHLDQDPALLLATPTLASGERLELEARDFGIADREPTILRGDTGDRPDLPYSVARRHRIQFGFGGWTGGPKHDRTVDGTVVADVSAFDLLVAFGYSRWIREDASIGIEINAMGADVEATVGPGVYTRTVGLVAILVSYHQYLYADQYSATLRPFLTVGVGSFVGSETETAVDDQVIADVRSYGAFGAQLGGGVDLPLGRHLMLDAQAAYNLMSDFREPIAGEKNFSSPEFRVGISWMFGKGVVPTHRSTRN